MPRMRALLSAAAIAWLAGCAASPPAPPPDSSHHCVVTPNGLVECSLREE